MARVRTLASILVGLMLCAPFGVGPAAAQTVTPPYTLATFATSAKGYSQPDSIAQWRDTVLVGFQNHVAKDGSDGKSSTIVEYSLSGKVLRTFSVKGHNDGLRVIGEDELWALQNEDANPTLVIIDLKSGQSSTFFPAAPHGGGYDDLVAVDDKIFMTASNPAVDPNVFPALVRVSLHGGQLNLEPVLSGNADAVDIPSGKTVSLDLTDPDSLSVDRAGNIVLNSQADAELVFIRHPLSEAQTVGRLSITTSAGPTTVDDTAFVPDARSFLLVSDVNAGVVYRIDRPSFGFEPGTAYSSSDTAGIVAVLNLDNGVLTPIATGFGSTRGMVFVVPPDEQDREQR
jgi:hypothetical protein